MRKRLMRPLAVTIGGLALALVAAGCASSDSDADDGGKTKGTLAFSHPVSTAPVTKAVQRYAKERAKQLGYKLVFDNPAGKVDVQVADIDTWITQKLDGITIFPAEPTAVAQAQKQAQAAGIVWSSYAGETEGADGAVLFSHKQSGEALGKDAVAWINKQSKPQKVLLLTATSLPSISDRWTVPEKMIKSETDAKIVASQDALDQETGLKVTEAALSANPDLRVVIGTNDDGALGALKAFADKGINPDEVYIGGQDGTLEALEAVKKGGYYKASVSVNVPAVGYAVVDSLVNVLEKKGSGTIEVAPILGSQADKPGLDKLIDQYK